MEVHVKDKSVSIIPAHLAKMVKCEWSESRSPPQSQSSIF